ncbi:MAG: FGGY-family carbohydrate kinase [Nevskiales bacterium]
MAIIVLDVGKSLTKLSLWTDEGALIERRSRPNARVNTRDYVALDVLGIEDWVTGVLRYFARTAPVTAIIPIGHGAAVAIVRDGSLVCPPMDYEQPIPAVERAQYNSGRDRFLLTGSPALPDGLNLGAQLHQLERLVPDLLTGHALILPWPQYWAWLLSGIAASEVTSLGCHSDLWQPLAGAPSALARSRGWVDHFAPLRKASDVLGPISPEWAVRTGLSPEVRIYCGLHDSNASLLAARSFPEIAGRESTVLSTGTWFVAMRTPASDAEIAIAGLPEARDCLVNVDVDARPVPSARFMGGREIEILLSTDARIDTTADQADLFAALPKLLGSGAMVLPSFRPGCGPFPISRGRWTSMPAVAAERRAAICLYAALVADVSLGLIGAQERILIEGRFAHAELFVRALASLRPAAKTYICNVDNDVSYGALRLIDPRLAPSTRLTEAAPLELDLSDYRGRWLKAIAQREAAA